MTTPDQRALLACDGCGLKASAFQIRTYRGHVKRYCESCTHPCGKCLHEQRMHNRAGGGFGDPLGPDCSVCFQAEIAGPCDGYEPLQTTDGGSRGSYAEYTREFPRRPYQAQQVPPTEAPPNALAEWLAEARELALPCMAREQWTVLLDELTALVADLQAEALKEGALVAVRVLAEEGRTAAADAIRTRVLKVRADA